MNQRELPAPGDEGPKSGGSWPFCPDHFQRWPHGRALESTGSASKRMHLTCPRESEHHIYAPKYGPPWDLRTTPVWPALEMIRTGPATFCVKKQRSCSASPIRNLHDTKVSTLALSRLVFFGAGPSPGRSCRRYWLSVHPLGIIGQKNCPPLTPALCSASHVIFLLLGSWRR